MMPGAWRAHSALRKISRGSVGTLTASGTAWQACSMRTGPLMPSRPWSAPPDVDNSTRRMPTSGGVPAMNGMVLLTSHAPTGAPRPSSFRLRAGPGWAVERVHAEAPAGSVVMWDARAWHGSGCNTTDTNRMGASITCRGPQFRPLRNHAPAIRHEVHASLDDTMCTLPGFASCQSTALPLTMRPRSPDPATSGPDRPVRARPTGRGFPSRRPGEVRS